MYTKIKVPDIKTKACVQVPLQVKTEEELYSNKCIHHEKKKISNKQFNFIPQELEKKEIYHRASRHKKIVKCRSKLNRNRKLIKIDRSKSCVF